MCVKRRHGPIRADVGYTLAKLVRLALAELQHGIQTIVDKLNTCIHAVLQHECVEVTSDGTPRPPDNTPLTIDASGVYFRQQLRVAQSGRVASG